jgi:hypothetical protein
MVSHRQPIRLADILILALSVACTIFFLLLQNRQRNAERSVVIQAQGGEWIYPLTADARIELGGPLGTTAVVIEGGSVRIQDSPCPNKTCVAMGAISHGNEWLACLPNKGFVHIEGREEGAVDAATY